MIADLFESQPENFFKYISIAEFLLKGGVWEYYTPMKILYSNEHGLQLRESICIKPTNTGKSNLDKHI